MTSNKKKFDQNILENFDLDKILKEFVGVAKANMPKCNMTGPQGPIVPIECIQTGCTLCQKNKEKGDSLMNANLHLFLPGTIFLYNCGPSVFAVCKKGSKSSSIHESLAD